MLRALISRIPSRSRRGKRSRAGPRTHGRRGITSREDSRQKPRRRRRRRQVSKAVSESAADYADRSISRSNESTDILIIFYRLVTTRLWQPSNGTGGRPSRRVDNRRGKGRGAREGELYLRWLESKYWFCGERMIETIGRNREDDLVSRRKEINSSSLFFFRALYDIKI